MKDLFGESTLTGYQLVQGIHKQGERGILSYSQPGGIHPSTFIIINDLYYISDIKYRLYGSKSAQMNVNFLKEINQGEGGPSIF